MWCAAAGGVQSGLLLCRCWSARSSRHAHTTTFLHPHTVHPSPRANLVPLETIQIFLRVRTWQISNTGAYSKEARTCGYFRSRFCSTWPRLGARQHLGSSAFPMRHGAASPAAEAWRSSSLLPGLDSPGDWTSDLTPRCRHADRCFGFRMKEVRVCVTWGRPL